MKRISFERFKKNINEALDQFDKIRRIGYDESEVNLQTESNWWDDFKQYMEEE